MVGAGLRDGIEAMGHFLEEVRQVCAVWSFSRRPSILGEEWISKMEHEPRRFHCLGLPDKIEFLRKKYGADAFLPDSGDEVLSINNARNCLVHRKGIVADRDLNTPEGLLLQWRKLELVVAGPSGERVIVPPANIRAGEALKCREGRASRLFRLGESVSFSTQEFAEMCWTLLWFGRTLVQKLEAYAKERGVKFTEPPPGAKAEGGQAQALWTRSAKLWMVPQGEFVLVWSIDGKLVRYLTVTQDSLGRGKPLAVRSGRRAVFAFQT